jgi:hypothetical protein
MESVDTKNMNDYGERRNCYLKLWLLKKKKKATQTFIIFSIISCYSCTFVRLNAFLQSIVKWRRKMFMMHSISSALNRLLTAPLNGSPYFA